MTVFAFAILSTIFSIIGPKIMGKAVTKIGEGFVGSRRPVPSGPALLTPKASTRWLLWYERPAARQSGGPPPAAHRGSFLQNPSNLSADFLR